MLAAFKEFVEIAAQIAVIAGASAIVLNVFVFNETLRRNSSGLFLRLRENFSQVYERMVNSIPGFDDRKTEIAFEGLTRQGVMATRQYWVTAFNEWYITNIVYANDRTKLWRRFFRNAQQSSILVPILRDSLLDMVEAGFSFGEKGEAYIREVSLMARDLARDIKSGAKLVDSDQREHIESFHTTLLALIKKRRR